MSNIDNTFLSVLTGTDCWGTDPIKAAVAKRATEILPNVEQKHPQGFDACYDGYRCKPENLGWRVQQNARGTIRQLAGNGPSADVDLTVEGILRGDHDDLIVYTYHDAASAEHYYRYEKDWGEF